MILIHVFITYRNNNFGGLLRQHDNEDTSFVPIWISSFLPSPLVTLPPGLIFHE